MDGQMVEHCFCCDCVRSGAAFHILLVPLPTGGLGLGALLLRAGPAGQPDLLPGQPVQPSQAARAQVLRDGGAAAHPRLLLPAGAACAGARPAGLPADSVRTLLLPAGLEAALAHSGRHRQQLQLLCPGAAAPLYSLLSLPLSAAAFNPS